MNVGLQAGEQLLRAAAGLLLNPFYYIGILFLVLQYRRQIALERKLFAVRLHSLIGETARTVAWGALAGLAASVLLAVTGVRLEAGTMILLWAVSLVLLLIRVRYLCLAYSAGVLGIAHYAAKLFWSPEAGEGGWLREALLAVHVPSLLVLTAVLHLMEGLLVRRQGARLALPLFLESKRGKLVGGYQLQGFWPVPLVMLVPTGGGPLTLPWEPLFSGGQGPAGWSLLAFPAIIGFSQLTTAYLPKDKLRQSSGLLWAYALAVAALAGLAGLWEPLGLLGAGLAALLHEAMIRYGSREEDRKQPLYVHDGRGMHILAVLPNSAAQEAGLQAGEIVHRVNGVRVRSKEEFHDALRINPAFCKLEVLNHEGHSKFVSRALYADAHHQLGLILSPDDRAPFFLSEKPPGFASYLRMKWSGMRRNDKAHSDFESFS